MQSPWPNWNESDGQLRSVRLYYDGVRRIQEVITDPVPIFEEMLEMEENAALQSAAEAELQAQPAAEVSGEAVPIAIEEQLADGVLTLEGAGTQSQTSAGGGEAGTFTYLHREYVWGPGDRGIDELLAVFTGTHPSDGLAPRTPWYTLTDTGGDVVALVEITSPGTPTAQAHVAAQWTYDPYGNVQSADYMRPHPHISVGHKGLFAERLDVPLMYAFGDPANPTLTPFSRIHYHTRNRVLDPTLGRWLQRDPYATGQDLTPLIYNGQNYGVKTNALRYGGYEYVRSNPFTFYDATGLYALTLEELLAATARGAVAGMGGAAAQRTLLLGSLTAVSIVGYQNRLLLEMLAMDDEASGGSDDPEYNEHIQDQKAALERIQELMDRLLKAGGKKNREAIKEQVRSERDKFNGHRKEIEQKWPGRENPALPRLPGIDRH